MPTIKCNAAITFITIVVSFQALGYTLEEYHSGQSTTNENTVETPMRSTPATLNPKFMACFKEAAERYNVNENLLIAHAIKESSLRPSAINRTSKGEAVGLMQIHSQWFEKLEKDYHITRRMLLTNPCLNINTGAWIIANNFFARGVSWDTVGAYYAGYAAAGNDARRWYYGGKGGIREIYRRLQKGEDPMLVAERHR